MQERTDTVVIGGGQAGLAMSAVLRDRGREHVVAERRRVGERWRQERWDSLRFQFPNWSLPSLAAALPTSVLQTDPTRYRNPDELPAGSVLVVGSGASGCQIADELLHAGRTVYLSVSRHRRAPRRYRGRDIYWWLDKLGRFAQTIDTFPGRAWPPSTVVTGANGGYDVDVRQMAANGVKVVGRVVGADEDLVATDTTANQILAEADAAYTAFLSAADQWARSHLDEDLAGEERAVACNLPLRMTESTALDLRQTGITTVVWATGYEYDYPWLHLPVLDDHGRPVQQRGVTAVPGVYFLGLHWMHTFKSGLFSGVGADAAYLADHLT